MESLCHTGKYTTGIGEAPKGEPMPYGEEAPASLDDSASTKPLVATLTGALVPRGVLRSDSTSESSPNWFATIISASPSWVTRRISSLRLAVSRVELEPCGFLMLSNLRPTVNLFAEIWEPEACFFLTCPSFLWISGQGMRRLDGSSRPPHCRSRCLTQP